MFDKSETYKNLEKAFITEAVARVKYNFYENVAKNAGLEVIAQSFSEISNNEFEHAEIWYKYLSNCLGSVKEDLIDSFTIEKEAEIDYENYSIVACQEGYDHLAFLFKEVGKIEKTHEEEFKKLFIDLVNNELFNKAYPVKFQCMKCGHIHIGDNAPECCPVCNHPKGFFEVICE